MVVPEASAETDAEERAADVGVVELVLDGAGVDLLHLPVEEEKEEVSRGSDL